MNGIKVTPRELDQLYESTFGSIPPAMGMSDKVQAVVLTHGMERVIHLTQELRHGSGKSTDR